MEVNLLELFDKNVKPALFKELKKDNAADNQVIYQHLTIVHASILGGLIVKSKKEKGAKAIKNLIEKGNHTGKIIEEIPEIFENEQRLSDIKKLGNSLLSFLFEDGTDKAFEQIQHFLSEKFQVTADDLIDINRTVAPFSMALIGRVVHEKNTTEVQLSELLQSHEPMIHEQFPSLAIVLGMQAPSQPASASLSYKKETTSSSNENVDPDAEGEEPGVPTEEADEELVDFKFFIRTLLPWFAVLVIAGASLILLSRFQSSPEVEREDNPFNFIQSDSLVFSTENTYVLPGNVQLKADKNSSLDSLLRQLKNNPGSKDTIRYFNTQIHFEDSSAILTSSANKELTNILAIMKSYTDLEMAIDIYYDSIFLVRHPGTAEKQVTNIKEYFTVFGVDHSRIQVNKGLLPGIPASSSTHERLDTAQIESGDTIFNKSQPPILAREERVDVLFYYQHPPSNDSINIH